MRATSTRAKTINFNNFNIASRAQIQLKLGDKLSSIVWSASRRLLSEWTLLSVATLPLSKPVEKKDSFEPIRQLFDSVALPIDVYRQYLVEPSSTNVITTNSMMNTIPTTSISSKQSSISSKQSSISSKQSIISSKSSSTFIISSSITEIFQTIPYFSQNSSSLSTNYTIHIIIAAIVFCFLLLLFVLFIYFKTKKKSEKNNDFNESLTEIPENIENSEITSISNQNQCKNKK